MQISLTNSLTLGLAKPSGAVGVCDPAFWATFGTFTSTRPRPYQIGDVVTILPGTTSGTAPLTITYQWFYIASPIVGATSASLTLDSQTIEGNLYCEVTVTNACGFEIDSITV